MEQLNFMNNISDSRIRHLIGFLPILSFILIFGYNSYFKIGCIFFLIILSAFFEFYWTILNQPEKKKNLQKIREEYNNQQNKTKLSEKEQWNFYKKRMNFVGLMVFFIVMFLVSIFFMLGFFITIVYFLLESNASLGILSAIYLFTSVYTSLLIIYNSTKK